MSGILMAGGQSSRMGRDKGFISLGGRMLYQFPLRVLEALCDEILISSCNDFPHAEGHRVVCDEISGIGPIGGLYTCLKKARHHLCLVISYDMPLVKPALFRHLLQQRKDEDIVVPVHEGHRFEPLCGLYHKNALQAMEAQIKQGSYALHQLFAGPNYRLVPVGPELAFYSPNLFLNINEKKDLDQLSALPDYAP